MLKILKGCFLAVAGMEAIYPLWDTGRVQTIVFDAMDIQDFRMFLILGSCLSFLICELMEPV